MSVALILPLGTVLLAAAALAGLLHRLPPVLATWALTGAAVLGALTVVSVLATMVLEVVHGVPWADRPWMWCLPGASQIGGTTWAFGALAVAWIGVALVRICRRRRDYRALRAAGAVGPGVEILATGEPTAYSLPGRPGRIVVSRGMLHSLRAQEREVLFAHERSHLSHGHDRFIHAADLASDIFPPLALLASRVRYATERWADEDAVVEIGDRRVVARAVARAALAQGDLRPEAASALAGHGVRRRVEVLRCDPQPRRALALAALVGVLAVVVLVGSSTLQVHHLAVVVEHICRLA
ncbi:MAG: M56 family metallopeptidase [Iamia sp.]